MSYLAYRIAVNPWLGPPDVDLPAVGPKSYQQVLLLVLLSHSTARYVGRQEVSRIAFFIEPRRETLLDLWRLSYL